MLPRFLYFDLGNVLLTFDNELMRRQLAEVSGVEEAIAHQALLPNGDTTDPQWRFEAGQFTADEFYEHFCTAVGSRPAREVWNVAAADMFAPIEASFELVDRLAAAGHRLGVLSNTNATHWDFVLDGRFPTLNRAFEQLVTSFDAKSMKPDRAIYDQAIQQAGVAAEEIFFVDDRPENVTGAKAVGIDAVQFVSTEQLIADLLHRGIEAAAC